MSTNFDPQQLAAISAFRGAFRVDACAGAGKTSTLVARLGYLKKQGVPECDMLALTFTRNAAEEMRTRSGAEKETLRTLHSWALAAVKTEVEEFVPRLRPFPLLTNQYEILIPISKQHSVQAKDLASFIGNCKRQGKTPATIAKEATNDLQLNMARAYNQYQDACHRMGVLDFDSIIWELVRLFDAKPHVADRHQVPFLMVDEAQDCSEMDWRLIRQITRKHGNVWIVGDFAQSVYGFRGASPEIFAAFDTVFPGASTLPMGTNYRSQGKIVEYSQKVMPEQTSYRDNWRWHKPGTTEPQFHRFNNDSEEAKWLLNMVISGSCTLNETAVLARTNAQLAILQGFCAEKQIPYKLLGKDNFWKRPEVLALLGLARNAVGYDDGALKHVLRSPLPCVKFLRKDDAIAALESTQERSLNGGDGNPMPLKHLLRRVDTGNMRQNEILQGLHNILEGAQHSAQTPFTLMDYLANKTGARTLGEDDEENSNPENYVQDNIRKVVTMAKAFSSIKDFVKFAATAGRPSRKQTRLILSTVHGFKGRESRNVFVIGVNLGIFPHDRAELQEEKRLYYVAVSRPTENLYVSCSGTPSPFIEEKVPEEVVPVPDLPTNPLEFSPLFTAGQ